MIEEIKIDRLEELIQEMMIKIRDTHPTNSAEGNPIEIENAAAAPLVKCVSAITGAQDLHGYDGPWVGGSGKNKLQLTLDSIKNNNTASGSTWTGNTYSRNGLTFEVLTDSADNVLGFKINGTATSTFSFYLATYDLSTGTYIYNGLPGDSTMETYYIDWRSDSNAQMTITSKSGSTYTSEGQTGKKSFFYAISGVQLQDLIIRPMIRLASVSDPTFEPYTNICPITEFSSGSVEVEDEDEQSTTYAATFTDPIYQGSIDYVAKKVTATWGYIASYDGETLPGLWISDRDEYATGTSPTTGAEVAYELASADVETVTVSNAPVSAVHGYNKIESSTGELEVTYITEDFEPLVPTT